MVNSSPSCCARDGFPYNSSSSHDTLLTGLGTAGSRGVPVLVPVRASPERSPVSKQKTDNLGEEDRNQDFGGTKFFFSWCTPVRASVPSVHLHEQDFGRTIRGTGGLSCS